MNICIRRELPNAPDGSRMAKEYLFATWNLDGGKIYLDAVMEYTLPPKKRKWRCDQIYNRLSFGGRGKIIDEKLVSLPQDVVDEALEVIRSGIHFERWEDRNKKTGVDTKPAEV